MNLTNAVTQITIDMGDYVQSIIEAEKKADYMSQLANRDSLTGIRNKTAYDKEIQNMEYEIANGNLENFGIAMIDLNFLKKINDTYGHEYGDRAIKNLSKIVCTTFSHSPVFRIGGDEFVAILKGDDLKNIETLLQNFKDTLEKLQNDAALEAWEKTSAAIGVAFYEKYVDSSILNVFNRADQRMYDNKKAMKATRE